MCAANVHQDHAGWGDAVTNAGIERDVRMMKEAGFNFIRGSHYPHDPAFSAACDRLGVLLWSENALWGIGGFGPDGYWDSSAYPPDPGDRPAFEASVEQQLREMIRTHRNHPSIITWSLGNEAFFTELRSIPAMAEFLSRLTKLARELDPTRPVAIGGVQRPLDKQRIDRIADIAGYNGDGASISQFRDPGVPNMVSEYGSTTADRPGEYSPGWGDLKRDGGQAVHPWRSGQAVWCGFDHGSIAGPKLGKMGLVDYFRLPKRAWYWYRNEYRHIAPPNWPEQGVPAKLKLSADKTAGIQSDGTDDTQLIVTVLDANDRPISNAPDVELKVVRGPGEFPTGPSISFSQHSDIRIADGQAAIEFRSYSAGRTTIRAESPGLQSAEIDLQFDGAVAYEEGVTPPVQPRPYTRFRREHHAELRTFGRNNPVFVSSSLRNHPAGFASDGDAQSFWEPDDDDPTPMLTLAMEKFVRVSAIKIDFAQAALHRYSVEVSDDQKTWKTVADLTKNETSEKRREVVTAPDTRACFVRLRFVGEKQAARPRVADIQVVGAVLE
ncbi:MAG: glycoside hydrolase family 2 TIM barrel-domain containing protein [Tepidisphaeraceae bacterium]